ncbi:MAG: tetratricopeptide repeat protein [Chloroflexota bacterium]
MSNLALSLLGPFEALYNRQAVGSFRTKKLQALLIYLVVESATVHQRDAIMALLWPDLPQPSAQVNLRQILYQLRQLIPTVEARTDLSPVPLLLSDRRTIQLNPSASVCLDVARFEKLLRYEPSLIQLAEAIPLYRGDFLSDFYLTDSESFEEWATNRRAVFQQQALHALEMLTEHHLSQGDYSKAEETLGRQLAIDNLRENAHRGMMHLLATSGRRDEAMAHYDRCRQIFDETFGTEPIAETILLNEQIRSENVAPIVSNFVTIRQNEIQVHQQLGPLSAPKESVPPAQYVDANTSFNRRESVQPLNNLPIQTTPFIGRQQELQELTQILSSNLTRLITITGPGGMGKTRLALAVGEQYLNQLIVQRNVDQRNVKSSTGYDGSASVAFVPLAQVDTPEQIIPAMAHATHFTTRSKEGENRELQQQLFNYLHEKEWLLILDNFEHLLSGATLFTELLQAAPKIKIVVTSRERLHLQGEYLFPVGGLTVPPWRLEQAKLKDSEEKLLIQYDAVTLFLDRVERAGYAAGQDGRDFDSVELAHVAHICQLVDGMPLALELAASWSDALPFHAIADEMAQCLGFLESKWQDVAPRHRSVRAAFDGTWKRLTSSEQSLFSRLSIFQGGFTRDSATHVAQADLRSLAKLVSKSLLTFNRQQERYQMHELLRQYGVEKLAQSSEVNHSVRYEHASYYCTRLKQWEIQLKEDWPPDFLATLEPDVDNIRVAWQWAVEQLQVDCLLKAVHGLCLFYDARSRYHEGLSACQLLRANYPLSGLTSSKTDSTLSEQVALGKIVVRATLWQACFTLQMGHRSECHTLLKTSEEFLNSGFFKNDDIHFERAYLLQFQGHLAVPDHRKALYQYEQSIINFRTLGDKMELARSLQMAGRMAIVLSKLSYAHELYSESLVLAQEIEHLLGITSALNQLGMIAREVGDNEDAGQRFAKSLTLAQEYGNPWGIAHCQEYIAWLAVYQGHFAEAQVRQEEANTIYKELGDLEGYLWGRENIAQLQWLQGQYSEASTTLEHVLSGFERMGDSQAVTEILTRQGEIYAFRGDHQRAQKLAQSVLSRTDELPEPTDSVARARRTLGWVALSSGENEEAVRQFQQAADIYRDMRNQWGREYLAFTLAGLSCAQFSIGEPEEARKHLQEGLGIVQAIGAYIPLMVLLPVGTLMLVRFSKIEEGAAMHRTSQMHGLTAKSPLFNQLLDGHIAGSTDFMVEVKRLESGKASAQPFDPWEVVDRLIEQISNIN